MRAQEVPEAVEAENLSYPPLALLSIAQFLLAQSDHEVKIIDAQLDDLAYDVLEAQVREWSPDVVGITAFTVQLVDVHKTIKAAKAGGALRVVVGGPHVNDFPQECLDLLSRVRIPCLSTDQH